MNDSPSIPAGARVAGTPAEIDASCRLPLLVLFLSAAVWALLGAGLGLLASLQFHSPDFLADVPGLTYGRIRPAGLAAMLYGFCVQSGLGVGLWLMARLGRARLAAPLLASGGAILWNLGLTIGFVGILAGDSTGFESLELPAYAVAILFLGYLLIGCAGVLTFHERRAGPLFAAQWFVLAALFWFPWIYSTAELLLVAFPVRGVMQAVIAWWYADNLRVVWLGLAGLATVFYLVPKLSQRELHSHYLALLAFWLLVLFGSWGGIPNTAPVPAWMPAASTVASGLMLVAMLAVALNVRLTLGVIGRKTLAEPVLAFVVFGVGAFILAALMKAADAVLDSSQELHFTWFIPAHGQLQTYGFFGMVMFAAVYHIMPGLVAAELPRPRLVRAHFWLAALGTVLLVLPLAAGGVVEALQLRNPSVPFASIAKGTLPFLRISTVGDLLIVAGQAVFLANLAGLVARCYRARAGAAYAAATAELRPAEVRA